MKTSIKLALILASSIAISANASISASNTEVTSFDVGGTVDPQCKVTNYSPERSTSLDLTTTDAQTTASISIWCNTGQGTAVTEYSSANNGYMVSSEGNQIAYRMDISGGIASDLLLTSPQTVNQTTGTGVNGSVQTRAVKIKPQVTGLEYAGTYTDTIAVTVSYN
ncbi:MAG: hypothetical protein GJ680_03620 [Alteromonadaceae bacterium]|nr:hypothetical protein [Alteromonadaceae bacterium]